MHLLFNAIISCVVFSETDDPKIVTAVEFSTGKDTNPQSVSVSKKADVWLSPHPTSIDSRISTYLYSMCHH